MDLAALTVAEVSGRRGSGGGENRRGGNQRKQKAATSPAPLASSSLAVEYQNIQDTQQGVKYDTLHVC
jgi:hypothetical protein